MRTLRDIPTKKLFLLALLLKVGFAAIAWAIDEPWAFGLVLPLAVMAGYIFLGINRKDKDVSDEKFADSCYYLGFIFTITSIVFSLLDVGAIGTKMTDIAVRFGAAMVSTVFGLAARVYLVSFRQDVSDAVQAAEDSVVEAANRLSVQLAMSCERFQSFELQVDSAARSSVERVNLQVEALSKSYTERLAEFFRELAEQNTKAFEEASRRLAVSVDQYASGLSTSLTGLEERVVAFADGVTERLATTSFPDDYFATTLTDPVSRLRESAALIAGEVTAVAADVKEASKVLRTAFTNLRNKATTSEEALERLHQLVALQEQLHHQGDTRSKTFEKVAKALQQLDQTLGEVRDQAAKQTDQLRDTSERANAVLTGTQHVREAETLFRSQVTEALAVLPQVFGTLQTMQTNLLELRSISSRAELKPEETEDLHVPDNPRPSWLRKWV